MHCSPTSRDKTTRQAKMKKHNPRTKLRPLPSPQGKNYTKRLASIQTKSNQDVLHMVAPARKRICKYNIRVNLAGTPSECVPGNPESDLPSPAADTDPSGTPKNTCIAASCSAFAVLASRKIGKNHHHHLSVVRSMHQEMVNTVTPPLQTAHAPPPPPPHSPHTPFFPETPPLSSSPFDSYFLLFSSKTSTPLHTSFRSDFRLIALLQSSRHPLPPHPQLNAHCSA